MARDHMAEGSSALQEKKYNIITIEATKTPGQHKLRVAAYARVSSGSDDQENSFAAQVGYYTNLIGGADSRQMVDVYLPAIPRWLYLKRISDELGKQPIRYDPERAWNKAMVNRILQDQRYTGDGRFPALIATDIFSSVQEGRTSRPGVQKKSDVERTVGQLSSMNVTSE